MACTALADRAREPLNHRIAHNIAALLQADDVGPTAIGCHVELAAGSVVVHLQAPPSCGPRLSQALAIRAFDAIRDAGWVRDRVDVHVHRTTGRVE